MTSPLSKRRTREHEGPTTHDGRVRVLHVVQNLNFGGMERLIAEMARRTDRERFDTHILALGYLGHFAQGLDEYATLHLARPMSRWSMLRPSSLAADIRAIAPDVVHTHGGVWYKTGKAARLAGVPYLVHTDHGRRTPDPLSHRVIDRLASRRVDVVVAVSDALRELLATIVHDPSALRVIRNGVNTDTYAPAPDDGMLRAELGIGADVPVIGSVGRLEHIKGYDVMVDAFTRLVTSWPDGPKPVLVLVGDGAERAALEAAATAVGVRPLVHFLGWRSDIESCQRAFTLFTMSSRSEGTSVSLLEAMSAGLCPVVTNVGGNAAVLGDALRHRLVPPLDPDALAAAWRDALTDPARRAADAAAARERVRREFSLDTMVRAYESLYAAGTIGATGATDAASPGLALR